MMSKPYKKIKLTDNDAVVIHNTLKKGVHSSRTIIRCQILRDNAQGKHAQDIATDLGVCVARVYQTLNRYEKEGLNAALTEKPRSGQPRKVTPEIEAHITAIACSAPIQGRGRWTLKLIAEQLVKLEYIDSISEDAVASVLKKATLNLG